MRVRLWAAAFLLSGCVILAGCERTDPKDAQTSTQIVGTWSKPLPQGAYSVSEARVEFKSDGHYTMRTGSLESSGSWSVREGKLVLDGHSQTIRELSSTRLELEAGETRTLLTRSK